MPQNANTTPSAAAEPAAPALPKPAAGLGGRSAVAAARAARRATRLPPAPITATAEAAAPIPDVIAAPPTEPSPPQTDAPRRAAPQPQMPQPRARRWRPTRGDRIDLSTPSEPSGAPADATPPPLAPEALPAPDTEASAPEAEIVANPDLSVFEHLVRGGLAPVPEPPADALPAPPPEPTASAPEPASAPAANTTAEMEIVAELGPGLRLRLRQLGFGTDAALAAAQPDQLRQGLGEISRMLNVEAWIEQARRREAEARTGTTRYATA